MKLPIPGAGVISEQRRCCEVSASFWFTQVMAIEIHLSGMGAQCLTVMKIGSF